MARATMDRVASRAAVIPAVIGLCTTTDTALSARRSDPTDRTELAVRTDTGLCILTGVRLPSSSVVVIIAVVVVVVVLGGVEGVGVLGDAVW